MSRRAYRQAGRAKTPSFVCEIECRFDSHSLKMLRSRLEAGRQLYNAVLGEAKKRLARMRSDSDWEKARALPKKSAERKRAYRDLRERHGFSEYALHKHKSLDASCWIREHLDVHTAQKVATRAFKAVEAQAFGVREEPRFKRYGGLRSLESKSNAAGIRFREDPPRIEWNGEHGDLVLGLTAKPDDPLQAHGLSSRVKYVRLVLRTIRGVERVFAQLVCEGTPYWKPGHEIGRGKPVAFDLGPSQVSVVAPEVVETRPFCAELDRREKRIRVLRRRVDRRRRANNPEHYNPDGTIKKGPKKWVHSNRQAAVKSGLAETLRRQAAHRKSLHGSLANRVIALGNVVKAEDVPVKAWQKRWGRSISHKAPATFQTMVERKAVAARGSFEKLPTGTTALSSRCLCGKREKKPLSQRSHECGCAYVPEGTRVDRDEFSAFLALHCEGGALEEHKARESWAEWGADCLLRPSSSINEAASGKAARPIPGTPGCIPLSSLAASGPGQHGEAGGASPRRAVAKSRRPLIHGPSPAGFNPPPGEESHVSTA